MLMNKETIINTLKKKHPSNSETKKPGEVEVFGALSLDLTFPSINECV